MNGWTKWIAAGFVAWALTAGLSRGAGAAEGDDGAGDVFVERFEGEAGERWEFDSTLEPAGLRWAAEGERRGLHFKSVAVDKYVKTHDHAWAEWAVGTRPFELRWTVELERGLEQRWFTPGVAVALTSAPPGKMGREDIAVTIGVHMAGIAASVRQGGFYDTPTEGHGAYSNIRDKKLVNFRDERTGGVASAPWPRKHPSGATLELAITRSDDHKIRFTVRWPKLPAGLGEPYWTGEAELPEQARGKPLRYVSVRRAPTLSVHTNYAGFVMAGVVRDIQGRPLSAAAGPVVDRFEQGGAVLRGGVELTLHGSNFRDGARVEVGGKPATNVRVVSEKTLDCRLPDLEADRRHDVRVVNPNGLFASLGGGVPYGRMVEAVRPREASPGGGDVVTVVGAGFEQATRVTIGGKAAEVVERLSPRRLKVRAPDGEVGPAAVGVRTADAAHAGTPRFGYAAHPYLFFHAEDVAGLRAKAGMPMFRHYRKRVLDEAARRMAQNPTNKHNGAVGALFNLAFAYTITGEEKYKDKLIDWVRAGWRQTRFDDFHLMSLAAMAFAYDVIYPELSPEDRASFQDYLDRGIEGYHRFSGAWFLGGHANFSNTVPVGNSGGMLAGLASMHSSPRAKEAVETAAKKAKLYPERCISPDGGCREGVQYWDFGGTFHLILAHALKHATGDDRGLLDHPHLKANVNFVRATLGGHGGMFSFNDTKQPWLGGYAVCADLGSRYDQPLMRWVADLCAEGGEKTRARATWAPFALMWRDEEPAPEAFPGVPTLAFLKDMQWGAMRSDGTFTPKLVLGVKGGRGPLTHHKQNDLGSFVLQANGEAYLVDPTYYEPKATDHTLPLIDGKGPGVDGASITEAWEKGPWRHMTVDSTDGYGKAAMRVRRLIVMHGEHRVVVLDDLVPAKGKPGKVTTHFQTAWPPTLDADAANPMIVRGQKGAIGLRCFGHNVTLQANDRRFRSNWSWAKIAEGGPGDWHTVSGSYTADPARPLVTVIQPAAGDADPPDPPRVQYADDTIEVRFTDGAAMTFKHDKAGWRFAKP